MNTNLPSWRKPSTGAPADLLDKIAGAIPVLEGENVKLRAPRITDFPLYAEIMMSDRAVYMGGPMDEGDTWRDFTQAVSGWLLRGFGLFTCEHGDAPAGFVFLHHEYPDPERELGWMFAAHIEGKGIAYEAAHLALTFAKSIGMKTLVSYVGEGNTRSANLATRLGATQDGTTHPKYPDDIVFRHNLEAHA